MATTEVNTEAEGIERSKALMVVVERDTLRVWQTRGQGTNVTDRTALPPSGHF